MSRGGLVFYIHGEALDEKATTLAQGRREVRAKTARARAYLPSREPSGACVTPTCLNAVYTDIDQERISFLVTGGLAPGICQRSGNRCHRLTPDPSAWFLGLSQPWLQEVGWRRAPDARCRAMPWYIAPVGSLPCPSAIRHRESIWCSQAPTPPRGCLPGQWFPISVGAGLL